MRSNTPGNRVFAGVAAPLAASVVTAQQEVELVHVSAARSRVLFRWRAAGETDADARDADAMTLGIRDDLFTRGVAVVGVTTVRGRVCLKLTVLNPMAERADLARLVQAIVSSGVAQICQHQPFRHLTLSLLFT
jgi:L-2,4-diaminobutyrate decarboxylase